MDGRSTPHQVYEQTGVSPKALRGYEASGLVLPARAPNGYRLFDAHQIAVIRRIRALNEIGIPLKEMHPFVDCLNAGSEHADDCPAALSGYRRSIDRIDRSIALLTEQRTALVEQLTTASHRLMDAMKVADRANPNLQALPADLVAPEDDGVTERLRGAQLPDLALPSTDGTLINLSRLGSGRTLLYVFPMTGAPDTDMPAGWDAIPGARGCSPHSCDVRNHYAELMRCGVARVYGLSSQPVAYQHLLVDALRLPYPLVTDEEMHLAQTLGLPTITAGDLTVYQRLALLVADGVVEHVFFPIFPPDRHAQVILEWLQSAGPGAVG